MKRITAASLTVALAIRLAACMDKDPSGPVGTSALPPTGPAGVGSISGVVLDGPTQTPLSDPARFGLRILAAPNAHPSENPASFVVYDSSSGSFTSRLLPAGMWALTFSVRHPWRFVFPGLELYADTTVMVEVAAGKTTVMPDLLLRRRAPLLLIAVETCPWSLPDPPTETDWGNCDSGYWGGADVEIEVNGVTGTRTAGLRYQASIGPAQYGAPPASWTDTPWSTYFDITVPGDYDVSIVRVAPGNGGATSWHLVPWRTSPTRVSVEQGLGYVEFEFWHR